MIRFNIKRLATVAFLLCSMNTQFFGQQSQGDWFRFPGFGPESPLTLTDQEIFIGVIGLAAISYTLAEYVFPDSLNLNYYQTRVGMNNEYFWGMKKVYFQNFGVEKQLASWFTVGAELNLQQWTDNTPNIKDENSFGIGAGIMTYYRWYLFGENNVSPYIEYGTGLFYGFENFPYNGTNFTFSHSTQLGVEYTFDNKNKLRVGYGQFHQSNNGYIQPNPGYDADGFSLSFSWFWNETTW